MNIVEALGTLDPANDEQWTADGLPRMDVIEELVGDKSITRADVTNAAPDFTRETAAAASEPNTDPETDADADADAEPEPEANPEVDAEGDGEKQSFLNKLLGGEKDEPADDADTEPEVAPEPEAEPEPEVAPEPNPEENKPTMQDLMVERDEKAQEMLKAQGAQEKAKKVADDLADEVNHLNRRIDMLEKADPNHGTAGVRAYLDQQNKNRLERARGLTKFIETTGIHPKDVAAATDPKAPIDRAMGVRKPARGSARPRY